MKEIKFSYNWNNKLNCKAFTTLRLHNPKKYIIGESYNIFLRKKEMKKCIIIDIKILPFGNINEFIAHLDTGYSLEECRKIIRRMYKHVEPETLFDFIVLARVDK